MQGERYLNHERSWYIIHIRIFGYKYVNSEIKDLFQLSCWRRKWGPVAELFLMSASTKDVAGDRLSMLTVGERSVARRRGREGPKGADYKKKPAVSPSGHCRNHRQTNKKYSSTP
jgi:hypothetical protein